jgi:uncharacterized RDD family membrane protein YckC
MENTEQILDAPQVEMTQLQYAGFWIRTGAYIIDTLIFWVVSFVLTLALGEITGAIINMVIGIGYFTLMEASSYQATLGKMAVGIKVGDANGGQISFGNSLGRYFSKILSALLLCIGFMMVGWDEKKQGLHDKLANTFVYYR